MNGIKLNILNFIWQGKSVSQFETWLYEQDSSEFEKILGKEDYLELISYDFRRKTIEQVKSKIKSVLTQELIEEFENEFENKEKAIKGICVMQIALDYYEKKMKNWDVEIGKVYEIIIINSGKENGNHSSLIKYVDRDNDYYPSGFIPIELFDIDLSDIPELYHKVANKEKEIIIEPIEWSEKKFIPSQYSFWEDFYNDDEKAVNTYNRIIKKLGIKNVW